MQMSLLTIKDEIMMDKILALLLILFYTSSSKSFAEYNGLHLEMVIEMKDGSEIHAYNFIAPYFLGDTTVNHLEKNFELILRNDYVDSVGEYAYFQHRITYDFTIYENVSKAYQLLHKTSVNFDSIKSVNIIDAFDYTYAIGMSGISTFSDTLWSQTPAIFAKSFGGRFCSHDIFIHEENDNTRSVIRKLEKKMIDHNSKLQVLEDELENSNGSEYYEIQEQHEKLEEGLDDAIYDIINEFLDDSKVIIITMCSC